MNIRALAYGFSFLFSIQALADGPVPTFASANASPDAVARISKRCDDAYRMFATSFGVEPAISLYILSREDWPAYSEQVYGMPSYEEASRRLIVAAGNSDFWSGLDGLLQEAAPASAYDRIRETYPTPGSATVDLSPFFELLVLHELGHAFRLAVPSASRSPEAWPLAWMDEFFANLFLHVSIARLSPELLPVLRAFPEAMLSLPTGIFPFVNLKDFGFPGVCEVSPGNYVWYQALLHRAAARVYDGTGEACLNTLLTMQFPTTEGFSERDLAAILKGTACEALVEVLASSQPLRL